MKRKASFLELLASLCLVASVFGAVCGTVSAAELNLKQDLTNKASWTSASSYTENVAPAVGDTILITGGNSNMGSALNLGYGYNVTGGTTTVEQIYLDRGNVWTINNPNEVADTYTMTFTSTVRVGGDVVSQTPATLNITAGTLRAKGYFAIGRTEKGVVNINGGHLLSDGSNLFLFGDTDGATSELNLSSGQLTVKNQFVMGSSSNSIATMNITGGTATLSNGDYVVMGRGSNSSSTINVDGADAVLNITKKLSIGDNTGTTAVFNLKNGTLNANSTGDTTITVGSNSGAKTAEMNVSGGTLNASKINVNNSGAFTMTAGTAKVSSLIFSDNSTGNVGGTTNITTFKLWKNAVAELSGTHTGTEISVDDNTELTITGTVGGNENNVAVNVVKQGVLTIDGGSLTTGNINVRKNAVLNIIGGGTLTTNGTLRTASSNDTMETGTPTVNVIDGTWKATSWIGHGFNVNSGVINVFSKGSVIHTNAGAWWPVGDGGTAIVNLYKGGTIDTAKIGFMKSGTILNFVPTVAESWNFTANTLTFDGNAKTTFGEVDGITAFNDENYQIVLTNASGNPNVQSNDYWDVSYDDTTKILSASMKKDTLTWTTPWEVACATVDGGFSGVADLSTLEADENGIYTFELFLHGDGDRNALAEYFTDSLVLFTGMDEEGKFEYLGDGMNAISYTGKEIADYFYWDLAAYNLANGTSLRFGGVPEPSTICLLLVGLVGIGILRRKK